MQVRLLSPPQMISIDQIFHLLNNNSGAISAITTIVLAITTIVYAYLTKKIADTSTKQLNLYTEPYLVFGEPITVFPKYINKLINSIQVRYTIKNISNVPIKYSLEESYENDKKEDSSETILYPGQTIEYTTRSYIINPPISSDKLNNFYMKIIYWELNNPKEKKFFSKSIKISEITESNCRWILIDNQAGKI